MCSKPCTNENVVACQVGSLATRATLEHLSISSMHRQPGLSGTLLHRRQKADFTVTGFVIRC